MVLQVPLTGTATSPHGPAKVFWENTKMGEIIKLREHPKAYGTKL